uniref:Uncharacterized protein n=1 Tax=Salix viminalis TaxID=40686 RepID=A0A6N2KMW0_SALVM
MKPKDFFQRQVRLRRPKPWNFQCPQKNRNKLYQTHWQRSHKASKAPQPPRELVPRCKCKGLLSAVLLI